MRCRVLNKGYKTGMVRLTFILLSTYGTSLALTRPSLQCYIGVQYIPRVRLLYSFTRCRLVPHLGNLSVGPCEYHPLRLNQKTRLRRRVLSSGEGGIRTLGGHEAHNGFRDRPIQPLWHLPRRGHMTSFSCHVIRMAAGIITEILTLRLCSARKGCTKRL